MSAATTIILASDLTELPRLADAADAFCDAQAVPDHDRFALQIVIEEVATNIIKHGFRGESGHRFSLTLSAVPDAVTVVACDTAPAYNPLARPEVDTTLDLADRPIGGLGVHLVKKMMPLAHYERRDDQNILTLTRPFTASP